MRKKLLDFTKSFRGGSMGGGTHRAFHDQLAFSLDIIHNEKENNTKFNV